MRCRRDTGLGRDAAMRWPQLLARWRGSCWYMFDFKVRFQRQHMKHLIVLVIMFTIRSLLAQGGQPLWTNVFGGPYGGYDEPHGLVCDSSGDAYLVPQLGAPA